MAQIKLIGLDKVKADFESFSMSGHKAVPRFLDLITDSAISLLKQNTPKDTGELAESWTVLARGSNYVIIGVPDSQEDKLQIILRDIPAHEIRAQEGSGLFTPYGIFKRVFHPGHKANNFMEEVGVQVNKMMQDLMGKSLAESHRFFRPYSDQANIGKIVGLTGTYYAPRRALGRSRIIRPRTGRITNRVRIGRQRRVGKSILKKIKIG